MNAQAKIKKLYSGLGWVSFFTPIRFWTGSLVELEKSLPKKGKILDLGCGQGILANYLGLCSSQRQVVGIEIDEKKLKFANRGIANVSFVKGDITKLKLPRAKAIVIADVLHHLKSYHNQELLIKRCYDLLTKKGLLLITEVDNRPFWKLILARIIDFILYLGEPILYRYSERMMPLLKNYFSAGKIKMKKLKHNPFPHVIYLCQKE